MPLTKKRTSKQAALQRAPVVEVLEPRILLSADLPGLDLVGTDPDVRSDADVDELLAAAEATWLQSEASDKSDDAAVIPADDPQPVRHELIIVDVNVPDYEWLLADVRNAGGPENILDVVLVDPQGDGIERVTELLHEYQDLDAIHLISHGSDGAIHLGEQTLDLAALQRNQDAIRSWGDALASDGDILIYGCDLAASKTGEALVQSLARLTGADVAASDDVTGHARHGGDWDLEYQTGAIASSLGQSMPALASWQGTLDITSNLVAHYTFDEGSGLVAGDSSATNNDGSLIGSPTWVAGQVGPHALSFGGDFDRIEASDNAATDFGSGDFSVGFWFNSTHSGSTARLVGDSTPTAGHVFFTNGAGDVRWSVASGGENTTLHVDTPGLFDGSWHHMVGVRSGADFSLYADGHLVGSENAALGSIDNAEPLIVGASSGSTNDYDGLIDDVRLYDRVLTASDINELFLDGGGVLDYPLSNGSNNSFEWITNVNFAGVDNTTGQEAGGYGDYSAQVANVTTGVSTDLSVTISPDAKEYLYAWIDWNQDLDFDDAGEEYILASNTSGTGPFTQSIAVPVDALGGDTRMRVSLVFDNVPSPNGTFSDGEVEDYTIRVSASNDPPVIGGVDTGVVTEDVDPDMDGVLAVNDALTVADPDPGESSFQAAILNGTYGDLTIDAAGNWDYAADNTQLSIQQLDAGESVNDVFTVSTADGTTHNITITLTGAEDAPTLDNAIADQSTAEDSPFSFTFAANTFSDVDASDSLTYTATLSDDSALPAWLSFDDATRTFSGTPTNSDLGTISVKVTADDGTSTVTDLFDLTVTNTDDPPVIGGVDTGVVTEDVDPDMDGVLAVNDALTVADPDPGESSFQAATLNGTYGDLTIDAAGNWDYAADNTQLSIQQLDAGESVNDVFTVSTADGTTHNITITLNGAEDAPTLDNAIADQSTAEDAPFSFTFAANTFSDVDASDSLTYTATLSDDTALPAWLSFDDATRTFSGTPTNSDLGTIAVKVTADDGTSTATDTFDLTVTNTNDPPVIGGVDTGTVTEDVDPDTDGLLEVNAALTVSDPDPGESSFQAATLNGTYGDLTIDAAGNWDYVADNTQLSIQQLDAGESVNDVFTVSTADGTTHNITITIQGAEDAPTLDNAIADQSTAEDAPFSFTFAANTFSDVDASDSLTYTATLSDDSALPAWLSFDGNTRTFSGTPANSDLGTISVKVTADDGTSTATDTFDLTVTNTDDPPVIGGVDTGVVTEDVDPDMDGVLAVNDALTVADPDPGESSFQAAILNGTYGDLTIDAAGNWDYAADNTQLSIQQLDAGESVNDVFTVSTADGTTHNITITLTGAEDAPTLDNAIADQSTAEDSPFSFTFAANTFSDVDASDSLTYTATLSDDSALPAWLSFDDATRTFSGTPTNSDLGTISVKVTADDGTSTVTDLFDLTVTNTDDPPVIGGVDTGVVTEDLDPDTDGLLEFNNALTVADPDPGESAFQAATTAGTYGSLTIDAAGNWAYEADNSQLAIQQLDVGESVSDVLTVATADGTTHNINITLNGAEDAPTVDNAIANPSATEDMPFSFTFAANSFGDVDASDTLTYAATLSDDSALPAWLSFDSGTRTFSGTPTNSDLGTISVKVTADDGSSTVNDLFDLTVTNTNDPPVIGGVGTGSVTEELDLDTDGLLEVSAALTVADLDQGESVFQEATIAGTYGSLTIDAAGNWSYVADNTQLAIQRLDAGESISDVLTVSTADGTTRNITITLNGAEDASVVGGETTGTVAENGILTAIGALSITDVDASDNPVSFPDQPATPGDHGYGDFILSGGTWTYTLNDAHPAVQALDSQGSLSDSRSFAASDGSLQVVTVTILGDSGAPVTPTPEPDPDPEPNPSDDPPPIPVGQLEPSPPPVPGPKLEAGAPSQLAPEDIADLEPAGLDGEGLDGALPGGLTIGPHSNFPQPLDLGEVVASVLASLDSGSEPSMPEKPALDSAQSFLAELRSFWRDDAPAAEPPSIQANRSEALWRDIDQMLDDLDHAAESEERQLKLHAEAAAGVGISLTAGFVSWALRAGSLVASFLAAMPAWRNFDPMPVLAADKETPVKSQLSEEEAGAPTDAAGQDARVEALFDRHVDK